MSWNGWPLSAKRCRSACSRSRKRYLGRRLHATADHSARPPLHCGARQRQRVSHMFGAADAPLITLFGPTPAKKFQPKVTLGGVITAQEFGGEAMTDIPVQSVIERLDQLAIHRNEHGDYPKNR